MQSFSSNARFEPAIAVNPTDPNNLVAVFFEGTNTNNGSGRFAYSADGGLTWTVAGAAPVPAGLEGAGSDTSVAADLAGTFYCASLGANSTTHLQGVAVARSTDGGRSFPTASIGASGIAPAFFADTPFIATSFPAADVAPDGTLYVAWIDFPRGSCLFPGDGDSPCFNSDVRLSVSRNGGRTWTAPLKVTDETNPTDQFFPWIAAHPDGLLSIMWLDRRLDPNHEIYDLFYTNTYDGARFLPNVRVTSVTSIVGQTQFIGDYNGLAATTAGVFPVWGDLRLNQPAIFSAAGTLAP